MHGMNNLRRIDLNLLVVLEGLLVERHVSRAAERLHMSQPAVSHALARLRELLGDPLLVRAGRGMRLTPRAQALERPLAQALQQVRVVLGPAGFAPAVARRTFRLAMSDYGAGVVLPGLVAQVRREAPGVDLVVTQASREAMLAQVADGDIDLALGVFQQLPEDVRASALFEERFLCALDAASLPRSGRLSLKAYMARPHALLAMGSGGGASEIDAALAALGQRRRIGLLLPHWGIAPGLIRGTDLILTVAARSLGQAARRGLAVCEVPFPVPPYKFNLLGHARAEGDPGQAWLRERLQAAARRPARGAIAAS